MTEKTLALLIPAYNAAPYLPRLLRSACNQTRPFDEIWVYDDCSNDGTAEIASAFGARVVSGDVNRGCSHGKNVLAAQTNSAWLHFHDADDELLPGFVENAHTWMALNAHDVVLFAFEERDEAGARRDLWRFDTDDLGRDAISFAIRVQINPFCGLYRRSAFLAAGGYDTDPAVLYNEDVACHLRLALAELRFAADDTVLVINHRRTNSMSASNQHRCAVSQYHVMRKVAAHPKGRLYSAEISGRLWAVASVAAAYLDWDTADRAVTLAKSLSGSAGWDSDWMFKLLCKGSPHLALRVREAAIRLCKPWLRSDHPNWRPGFRRNV